MTTLTIDSTNYEVGILSVKRSAQALDKFAERTENGTLQRELIGVFYNYEFECGMSRFNITDYANLFLKLSEPSEFHTITVPGAPSGYATFSCYFSRVTDELYRHNKGGVDYFRRLTFSVIARSPARTP